MEIRVAELFAGVGGFRVGLERANKRKGVINQKTAFKVSWSNQWEPNENAQHASKVYVARFGDEQHSNEDISTVDPTCVADFDVLVGGFPCQDYSVAKPRNQSKGLEGKKGVLWWDIHRFLEAKRPWMAILENVDRLLASPVGQRGRDFAIMLATLNDLGYAVEWRVINAADYGFPQRRRRVFIIAHRDGTPGHKLLCNDTDAAIRSKGLLARTFPVTVDAVSTPLRITDEPWEISKSFNVGPKNSPFLNAGVAINGKVTTVRVEPSHRGKKKTLGDVVQDDRDVPDEYFIPANELPRWREHKGAKRLLRTKKNGVQYEFAEGAVAFPDALDKASRTIITSEGGRSPSRFKHVVRTTSGRFRRLTPVELERLSGFPPNHTRLEGVSDSRRAFFIGNALVTGLITELATTAVEMKLFRGLVKDQERRQSSAVRRLGNSRKASLGKISKQGMATRSHTTRKRRS